MNSLAGIDMGRILLDLSNEVIKQLDDLEVQRNLPRADLLREAVDQYLIINRKQQEPVFLASGKGVRKMVSNISVSCARNGNGKK
ncbi:thymol sensitivity protein [Escherichia coli]|nr:thymol sensitivity protein [Escherichia coli]